jgi:hypothetical protein
MKTDNNKKTENNNLVPLKESWLPFSNNRDHHPKKGNELFSQ